MTRKGRFLLGRGDALLRLGESISPELDWEVSEMESAGSDVGAVEAVFCRR